MRVAGEMGGNYAAISHLARVTRGYGATGMPLDRIDRKILAAVQQNCMIGAEELGELCGTSSSTALRRLRKLRTAGVIRAEVAVLDGKKVNRGLLMIVGVRLEREDARLAAEFRRRLLEHPAVMQMYFVTGLSDYILHISAESMEEYDEFVETVLISNPHVAMSETHVVIRPLKMGLALPLAV